MKIAIIAGLAPLLAIGGALSAHAASRTVETHASLEVRVWQSLSSQSLYLSTRPPGGEWTTHDSRMAVGGVSESEHFRLSSAATISVPVVVEVDDEPGLPEVAASPAAADAPPSGPARCCTVRGMSDNPAARRDIVAEMRGVIAFAREHFELTHRGPITINISHTVGGLLVRHEEAFGEGLTTLPSECSFQQGEHMFFAPACRADERAIAREWIIRATDLPHVTPRWAGVATAEYVPGLLPGESAPTLRDEPFRRVLFYEEAADFRAGRSSDEMMTAAMLYAIHGVRLRSRTGSSSTRMSPVAVPGGERGLRGGVRGVPAPVPRGRSRVPATTPGLRHVTACERGVAVRLLRSAGRVRGSVRLRS